MNPEELRRAMQRLPVRGRRNVKPETEWLNFVRSRLKYAFGRHCRVIKILGGIGQEVGIADLIGCIRGTAVALELKTPSGRHKLSPAQADFLSGWKAAGGFMAVIDSQESLEAVIDYFKPQQETLFKQ